MPYPNEHAARLMDPERFEPGTFRRRMGSGNGTVSGAKVPGSVAMIYGKLKGAAAPSDPVIPQALRFPKDRWTAEAARKWLADNKVEHAAFEPASEETAAGASLTVPAAACRFAGPEAVELEAAGTAGSPEEKKPRQFRMLANSGRPFRTYFGLSVVDLETLEAPERIPVLVNHDRDQIAGYAETAAISGRGYELAGKLSDATEAGRKVAQLSDEGFPWQSSFGLIPGEVREVPSGRKVAVNGEEHDGPLAVLSGCRLTECSFVPAGADGDTSAEALGAPALVKIAMTREEGPMSNDPTPTPAATSAAPAPAPDPLAEERARVAGILAEAAALGMLPQAEKLVASGTSLADARLSLRDAKLAAIAAAAPAPVGTDPTPSAVHASLPLGERAKMEFASRPDIRDEFGRVEHYEAWLRNEPLVRLYTKATDMAAPRAAGR